jgi:hypothetical protein
LFQQLPLTENNYIQIGHIRSQTRANQKRLTVEDAVVSFADLSEHSNSGVGLFRTGIGPYKLI